jgi:hypothetical protein
VEDPAEHDRRKHRRFSLRLAAVVTVGADQRLERGQLIEMSAGGASLSLRVPVSVDSSAYLRFLLPDGRECEATGTVVRAMPMGGEHGMALEFRFVNGALDDFLTLLDATPQAARPDLLADIRDLHVQVA